MNKTTYERELAEKGFLIYTTTGGSMRPFLRSGEDLVRIEAKKDARFRKYDAVLYRRPNGKYVLHRIVKVLPDSYVICGDNCRQLEKGITDAQILGVLTAVIRRGKSLDVNAAAYRWRVKLWHVLYPLRAAFIWMKEKCGALLRKCRRR